MYPMGLDGIIEELRKKGVNVRTERTGVVFEIPMQTLAEEIKQRLPEEIRRIAIIRGFGMVVVFIPVMERG